MYVARPPEPRPPFCQPDGSVRPAYATRKTMPTRTKFDSSWKPRTPRVTSRPDADALRQIADAGAGTQCNGGVAAQQEQVRFTSRGDANLLRGPSRMAGGASHPKKVSISRPVLCGRQAGRGLGMGLPRGWRGSLGRLAAKYGSTRRPVKARSFKPRFPWRLLRSRARVGTGFSRGGVAASPDRPATA